MALVNCPECSGSMSDEAAACPHCGRMTDRERKAQRFVEAGEALIAVVVLIVLFLLWRGWL